MFKGAIDFKIMKNIPASIWSIIKACWRDNNGIHVSFKGDEETINVSNEAELHNALVYIFG